MATIRLTAAQAMTRWLAAQLNEDGETFIAGVWAIFGHGNVAGMGEALHAIRDRLPTWRGHNEQGMALAAVAYAKARFRKRAMAVTSSIGPGATNMVTAAAVAHVNRLPLLLVPGDVYADRAPDPVLQQVEDFADGTLSANDCFRPVSRYFDRITRPEQLLTALPRAMAVMTDPALCGPVTLALCQDVQAEAFDWPTAFFEPRTWRRRRVQPDPMEITEAARVLRAAERPLVIAGGGVLYADACDDLKAFAETFGVPVAETQAGKSALPWDHPLALGSVGVTGSSAANALAREADVVLAVGTRLQDFTTGSWALFARPGVRLVSINVQPHDAMKKGALPVVADAKLALRALSAELGAYAAPPVDAALKREWLASVDAVTAPPQGDGNAPPSDMQVIGAVQRGVDDDAIVVCAAGGLPGELHKLWKARRPGGYHLEYGFSCMGYEIAGGLGVKMARPDREVVVMVGDGSYMMMNSELATAVMLGLKLTVVVLDNRGFACINRLQRATGGESFNNLLNTATNAEPAAIDFVAHAASMGAVAEKAGSVAELEDALARARAGTRTHVIVIDTDPAATTPAGGHWWDVAVAEVSDRAEVRAARAAYEAKRRDIRRVL